MSVSEIFVRRPVMTTLVMVGILVFGIAAYKRLPVADLPNVDFPTIQVTASLPGASPETMASAVATPLEKTVLVDPRARFDDLAKRHRPEPDHSAIHA